jgi:hypothetical protein
MWAKFTPISPQPLDKLKSSPLSRADVYKIESLRLHRKHVSYTCLVAEGIGRPQDAALLRGSALLFCIYQTIHLMVVRGDFALKVR